MTINTKEHITNSTRNIMQICSESQKKIIEMWDFPFAPRMKSEICTPWWRARSHGTGWVVRRKKMHEMKRENTRPGEKVWWKIGIQGKVVVTCLLHTTGHFKHWYNAALRTDRTHEQNHKMVCALHTTRNNRKTWRSGKTNTLQITITMCEEQPFTSVSTIKWLHTMLFICFICRDDTKPIKNIWLFHIIETLPQTTKAS